MADQPTKPSARKLKSSRELDCIFWLQLIVPKSTCGFGVSCSRRALVTIDSYHDAPRGRSDRAFFRFHQVGDHPC